MLLWRQRWGLIVLLAFLLSETLVNGENRKAGHENVPKTSASTSSLSPRKMDVDRQGGTLAGPMFLGLATMLFPVLPVLLLAPLAMAGIGPLRDLIGGGSGSSPSASSPIGDILNSIGSGNSGPSAQSALGSLLGGSEPATSGSALSSVAQALGLGSGASESSAGASLLSGLFGGSSSGSSSSGSLLSSLFSDNSGPTLFGNANSGGSGSAFGNAASGSRPVPSIALPPNKQTGSAISSADLLGAAVAALDNAGVLGSLSGLGGAGSASAIQQLLSVAGVGGSGGSSGSGRPTASSSALTEILNGIGSNLVGSASAPVPTFSAANMQKLPPLGASLSSNIIQGLPAAGPGGIIHQGVVNAAAGAAAKPSGSSLSNLLGLGGGSQSGSFQKLANNALNSITNFLFSRRRSGGAEWPTVPHYPEFLLDGAAKSKGGMFAFFREAFSTLKDGIRRYEISESDCQARLICEMQKPMGRSFRSWTNSLLDLVGIEGYLDQTKFGARTKSALKDFYQAARNGLTEKDCAMVYNKCPIAVAVEPMRNTVISKIIGRPQHQQQHPGHVQRPSILSYIQSVPKTESKQSVPHVHVSPSYHHQAQSQHTKPQPQQQQQPAIGVIGETVAQTEPLTLKKQPQYHHSVQPSRL